MKKILILLILLPVYSDFSYAKSSIIRVWANTINSQGITQTLLELALNITKPEYGEYQLLDSIEMEQDRALRELANNRLDIGHFAATAEREKLAIPIRIPIMQGLLGYRLCLIKDDNQQKFSDVRNKQQWITKKISVGQHHNWPDTAILQSNGIDVRTTFKHTLLFDQLAKNRFDCFARGVNEISYEQYEHRSLGLAIEKNIVLYYPLPQFFFVNPQKPLLAERLQVGLTKLQKSGEIKKLFDFYFRHQLTTLNIEKRTFIELQNPTLSPETINALPTALLRVKDQ